MKVLLSFLIGFFLFSFYVYGFNVVEYSSTPLDINDEYFEVIQRSNPNDEIKLRFALYQRNLEMLDYYFWDVSEPSSKNFHKYWSKDEIIKLVSPLQIEQDLVILWLRESGCYSVISYGDYVDAFCSIHSAEKLLGNIEIYDVIDKLNNNDILKKIISGKYYIPNHVSSIIEFLQNTPMNVHKRRVNSFGSKLDSIRKIYEAPSEDQVIPATLMNLYSISHTITTNSSQNVAEFSPNGYLASDLVSFDQGVGLPNPNPITAVGSFVSTPPNVECTLDIQMITSIGQNGQNYYYTVNGWILDFAQELLTSNNPPLVNSVSWSADERTEGYAYNSRTDSEFQKLGLMGISILAASGDDGAVGASRCSGNLYEFNPGYPATSPYVTSVGATMLVGKPETSKTIAPVCGQFGHTCAVSGTEDPADENLGGYATGGGFSVYETRPSYQDSVVTEYLNDNSIPKPSSSYFNSSNRGFPDVAANGYNILIYRGGRWEEVGGTSAATPIWGGIYALINDVLISNNKSPIGFANPLLYQLFSSESNLFTNIGDLTTNNDDGCPYGYTSNPNGWDPVTGLGTPNVNNILTYISSNLNLFP